jgi:tetratricopeptide (TPR) repeat protein
MHPLVHAWAKDRLAADAQNIAWATAASILSLSIESFEYHEFFHKIQSHIEFSVGPDPEQLFANSKYPGLEIGRILYRFTCVLMYLGSNGDLAEVVANVLCSRIGSEISPQSLNWRYALYLQAMCKNDVAKYNEEIDILKKVVSFDKDNLPAEDWDSVRALMLLGTAHRELGKYPEARGLLEDVQQMYQKLLPPTHPSRLASQHELARAYLNSNQVDKAIEIFEEVVQIKEKTLPPTHPDRLASQHELARAYLNSNQVDKAIEIFEEVVQIREKTLPSTHPERLASQHELARAYYERREYQKALPIIQEVVRIRSELDEPGYQPRVYAEQLLSYCRSGIEREVSRSGIIPDASGAAAVQYQ